MRIVRDLERNVKKWNTDFEGRSWATVDYMVLPQLEEVVHDAALLQVVGDHPAARGQAGLNVGLHTQPSLHRLLGQQPCTQRIENMIVIIIFVKYK